MLLIHRSAILLDVQVRFSIQDWGFYIPFLVFRRLFALMPLLYFLCVLLQTHFQTIMVVLERHLLRRISNDLVVAITEMLNLFGQVIL